jgi:hypothetical protein
MAGGEASGEENSLSIRSMADRSRRRWMNEEAEQEGRTLSHRVEAFLQRLFRDPRYLLIGKVERFGRDFIAFIEGTTILSSTGEVKGQALLNEEYALRGRPDGQFPFGEESLLDYYLASRGTDPVTLDDGDFAALRDESWQYYVRRNFAFQMGDFGQAREDAEHNLGIWDLIEQSDLSESTKWSYLRWWPWIERDRALAQALLNLEQGNTEHAAAELYRVERAIEQFGERHAGRYAQEEGEDESLCGQLCQHVSGLVELLREEQRLPVALEEELDKASERGDAEEVERLRLEMIRRTVEEGEG